MGFYRSFLIVGLLPVSLLTGCSVTENERAPTSEDASEASAIPQDSAYTLLQNASSSVLEQAFNARSANEYFRRTRTRQTDPATGRSIASYQRLVRYQPVEDGSVDLVEADSSGSFELGVLSGILHPSTSPDLISNPVPHLFPDDPAYLSDRGPGLYRYELLPDTSIANRPIAVVNLTIQPGAADEQQVQTARFYIDRSTMELVGMRLHRRQKALLFSEESTVEVYLQRINSDQWFPEQTRYRTILDIPFMSAKQLETETHYSTRLPEG